jgi:hypothetical protein
MSQEDLPNDADGPPQPHRRRRAPVLDLEAKEVGAGDESAQAQSARPSTGNFWNGWRARAAAFDWRARLLPAATGAAGVIGGALIAYLLLARNDAPDPQIGELRNQVTALSAQIESLAQRPAPAAPDNTAVLSRLEALTQAVQAAEKRLAAVEERPTPKAPDLSSVNERSAAIESTLQELRAGLGELKRMAGAAPAAATPEAIGQIATRIGALEQRIAAFAARPAPQPQPAAEPLAEQSIALNELREAALSGAPYAVELGAAQARFEHAALLAPLEANAKIGLPTLAALRDDFQQLVPELFQQREPVGGFLDRLVSNATRLVVIRPVGEPEGTGIGAVVARAETKLERGDLAGAIKEIEALPEPTRAKASAWLARAQQRLATSELVDKLVKETLASHAERGKP